MKKKIVYKYNEDRILKELQDYIDKTYDEHYSGKIEVTEMLQDKGFGEGHCIGNMVKYPLRYGKKGSPPDWRKDIVKSIHYGIMMLHEHDSKYGN